MITQWEADAIGAQIILGMTNANRKFQKILTIGDTAHTIIESLNSSSPPEMTWQDKSRIFVKVMRFFHPVMDEQTIFQLIPKHWQTH